MLLSSDVNRLFSLSLRPTRVESSSMVVWLRWTAWRTVDNNMFFCVMPDLNRSVQCKKRTFNQHAGGLLVCMEVTMDFSEALQILLLNRNQAVLLCDLSLKETSFVINCPYHTTNQPRDEKEVRSSMLRLLAAMHSSRCNSFGTSSAATVSTR